MNKKINEAYGQLKLAILHFYNLYDYVTYNKLEMHSGISRSVFRPIIKELISEGFIARNKGGMNEDGEVVGGTWTYLTREGRLEYERSSKPG